MKSSKPVYRAAIFVQTVSFMQKFRLEMSLPITVDTLIEVLKTRAYFSWMCCVVTEFAHANTIIFFNLGE